MQDSPAHWTNPPLPIISSEASTNLFKDGGMVATSSVVCRYEYPERNPPRDFHRMCPDWHLSHPNIVQLQLFQRCHFSTNSCRIIPLYLQMELVLRKPHKGLSGIITKLNAHKLWQRFQPKSMLANQMRMTHFSDSLSWTTGEMNSSRLI